MADEKKKTEAPKGDGSSGGETAKADVAFREEVGKVIVGNREIVDGVLTCMLAGSHALLEGVPGLGKTMLVRTLAEALSLSSRASSSPPT
jgi:MoxR-like ATPase